MQKLELVLGAPDAITRLRPDDCNADDVLELECSDPAAAFGSLLRETRLKRGETQAAFADRFWVWGLKQVAVSAWERGHYFPGRAQEALVLHMSAVCQVPRLFAVYLHARKLIEVASPCAQCRDISFQQHLELQRPVVERIVLSEGEGFGIRTVKSRNQAIIFVVVASGLPSGNNVPARKRGLGWSCDQVTPLAVLNTDVADGALALLSARRGGGRPNQTDYVFAARLAHLTRPHGAFWRYADVLAQFAGPALGWLATHWPANADSPGAECTTLAERIRAQCYVATAHYRKLAALCPNRKPTSFIRLESLMQQHRRVLVGVFRLLRRMGIAGSSLVTDDHRYRAMSTSLVAVTLLRPLVSGDREYERWSVEQLANRAYELVVTARNGTTLVRLPIPECLVRYVSPYHILRRSLADGSKPYYLRPDGTPLKPAALQYHLNRNVRNWARDIFPRGLALSDLMAIVVTDLLVCCGADRGSKVAGLVCRQNPEELRLNHALYARLPEVVRGGETHTLKTVLQSASRGAGKAKYARGSPRPPRRLRRTQEEIRRAKSFRKMT